MSSIRSSEDAAGSVSVLGAERLAVLRGATRTWGRSHRVDYPWRNSSLPLWQRLVAEVMLLRTRADQVVAVWSDFVDRYPTPDSLQQVTAADAEHLSARLGLRWRAALLLELFRELAQRDGKVPDDAKGLSGLPGVGSYTAAAMVSLHMGRRAVLIDANTVRLLSRLVGLPYDGETRRRRWLRDLADQLTPSEDAADFNYGLLDLAMTICRRRPDCGACPLRPECVTGAATLATELPR